MIWHAQAGQDRFAYEASGKINNGKFVDIGCDHPSFHSNTFALETLGWNGLMVDIHSGCESRQGTFIVSDAANPTDSLKIQYSQLPPVVDYLSLDCDDATMGAFNWLPWDRVTFRAITLETDVYKNGPDVRDKTRTMLRAIGYHLLCADVVVEWPKGTMVPFEDWWIFPELVEINTLKRMQSDGLFWKEIFQ